MTETRELLARLCAHVKDEIASRERLCALVQRQEEAVLAGLSAELASATREIGEELDRGGERARTRARLFEAFGKRAGVAASELTLRSIAERVGPEAQELSALSASLADAAASLAKKNRRFRALAAMHRGVLGDLIQVLLGGSGGSPLHSTGTLVNAEA